jgi:uncharacterized membrane protein YfcA
MIVIAGALSGAILGWLAARKRGGTRWDIAQYAAAYAIALALLGLFVTILLDRTLL